MHFSTILDTFSAPTSLDDVVEQTRRAVGVGAERVWLGQNLGWDPVTALAVAGSAVPGVGLGTAVVPIWLHHPVGLAEMAVTAQAATGGRFSLGVGLGHPGFLEPTLGITYDRPVLRLREYLEVVGPLLRGETAVVAGETQRVDARLTSTPVEPPGLLTSAMGPRNVATTGELADGTITFWASPRVIGDGIAPGLRAAAERAGRPEPQLVAGIIACLTNDETGTRIEIGEQFAVASEAPAYRAVLDRAGAEHPGEVAMVGDEATIGAEIRRYADAGATELLVFPYGGPEQRARTIELVASKLGVTSTTG